MSFLDLGIEPAIVYQLKKQGITEPFEVQEAAIPDTLLGKDICCRAPTGSGKTLAFGLPLIARCKPSEPGRPSALIVTPTRELAEQICNVLTPLAKEMHLKVLAVYGGTSYTKHRKALDKGVDIVVACPGRLIDLMEQGSISLENVEIAVLDEADRMADMGFLPQVEWILRHIEVDHQTMLFSATLDGAVDTVVKRHLHDPVFHEVDEQEVTVSEMGHVFMSVHKMNRVQVAARIIERATKTMLFTRTKGGADQLDRELRAEGVKAAAIHGDLRQNQREKALKDFSKGTLKALVATDVAARGIHVDHVDVVVHYNPAEDHKTYLHRSGRTARAGAAGTAVTMFLWDEEIQVRQLQRRLGLKLPLHEVFSNDTRLDDLPSWAHEQVSD